MNAIWNGGGKSKGTGWRWWASRLPCGGLTQFEEGAAVNRTRSSGSLR
ncbi:MAG TPA: hypothetical protein VKY19_22755 [Ktedonosporobacter sp.]|nr:hypothetical protein [Ktedonosporobacter sp.]